MKALRMAIAALALLAATLSWSTPAKAFHCLCPWCCCCVCACKACELYVCGPWPKPVRDSSLAQELEERARTTGAYLATYRDIQRNFSMVTNGWGPSKTRRAILPAPKKSDEEMEKVLPKEDMIKKILDNPKNQNRVMDHLRQTMLADAALYAREIAVEGGTLAEQIAQAAQAAEASTDVREIMRRVMEMERIRVQMKELQESAKAVTMMIRALELQDQSGREE